MHSISARELTEWMAFEHLEGPLGPVRGDVQAGVVASTLANAFRSKKGRPMTPEDFMPKWGTEQAAEPTDHMASQMSTLKHMVRARERRQERSS